MNPFQPNGLLAFLSDFGTRDAYAAEVHGVILARFPSVRIVDATHEIPPQDVRCGAFLLRRIAPSFPPGTVFLAVVDPGVGTSRRPVVARSADRVFVGPDNGLLGWAAGEDATWRTIDRPDLLRHPVAPTFHGRDLFGPVAGALASGSVEPSDCGPLLADPIALPFPGFSTGDRRARGHVIYVDRFGNLVLSIPSEALAPLPDDGTPARLATRDQVLPATWGPYAGAPGLSIHVDSSGFLEVALYNGRADSALQAAPGEPLEASW